MADERSPDRPLLALSQTGLPSVVSSLEAVIAKGESFDHLYPLLRSPAHRFRGVAWGVVHLPFAHFTDLVSRPCQRDPWVVPG